MDWLSASMFGAGRRDRKRPAMGMLPVQKAVLDILNNETLRPLIDPQLRSLGAQVLHDPYNQKLAEFFFMKVQMLQLHAAAIDDPFLPNYPIAGELPERQGILLLTMPSGLPLVLSAERLLCGLAAIGPPGAAKTTVMFLCLLALFRLPIRVAVLVIDRKMTWRSIATMLPPGLVKIVNIKDLALTLCHHNNPQVPRTEKLFSDTELIGACCSTLLSHRILYEDIERSGIVDHGLTPSMLAEINGREYARSGFREKNLREGVSHALHFLEHTLPCLNFIRTNCVEQLVANHGITVIEVSQLPHQAINFAVGLIARDIYLDRLYSRRPDQPMVLLVLDDITPAIMKNNPTYAGNGPPLIDQLEMFRHVGIGAALNFHGLSTADPRALQAIESKILVGGRGEDEYVLRNMFGLNERQAQRCRVLQPGEAVALVPSAWPKSVFGYFPRVEFAEVSDEFCRATAEALMASVTAERANQPQVAGIGQAADADIRHWHPERKFEAVRAMLQFTSDRLDSMMEHGRVLDIRPGKLTKLVNRLERYSLVARHSLIIGRANRTFIEVCDSAYDLLEEMGHEVRPRKLTRGHYIHELTALAWGEIAACDGLELSYEVDLGAVRFDVAVTDRDHVRTIIQIALSNIAREAEVLGIALRMNATRDDKFVVVVRDAASAKDFTARLREHTEAHDRTRVDVRAVGKVIDEARKKRA